MWFIQGITGIGLVVTAGLIFIIKILLFISNKNPAPDTLLKDVLIAALGIGVGMIFLNKAFRSLPPRNDHGDPE